MRSRLELRIHNEVEQLIELELSDDVFVEPVNSDVDGDDGRW